MALDARGVEIRTGARADALVADGRRRSRVSASARPRSTAASCWRAEGSSGTAGWPPRSCPCRTSPRWAPRAVAATACAWRWPSAPCSGTRPRGGGCRPCTCRARRSTAGALPAAARRARPARGDHGGPHGPALRRRGPELRRRGPGHARASTPSGHAVPGAPCWLVFDAAYRGRYPVGPSSPGGPDPAWLRARRRPRRAGHGSSASRRQHWSDGDALQRRRGDAARTPTSAGARFPTTVGSVTASAPHPTLAPLCEAPFYAAGGPPRLHGDQGRSAHRRPRAGCFVARAPVPGSTRRATRRPARSGRPPPRAAPRSAPRWCSASEPARRRRGTGDRRPAAGRCPRRALVQELLDTTPGRCPPAPAGVGDARPATSSSPGRATRAGPCTTSRSTRCGGGCGRWRAARSRSPTSATPSSTTSPGMSLVVVRSGPDEIRAFHNSCLHRGTRLRTQPGPRRRAALPLPRVHLEPRRHASRACRARGTSPTSTRPPSACPRRGSGRGAGSCSSTVDPDAAEPRGLPRDPARAFRLVGSRGAVPDRARRARRPLQLEGGPRGVHRELPHRGRPPPAAQDQWRHPDPVRRVRGCPPREPHDHAGRGSPASTSSAR